MTSKIYVLLGLAGLVAWLLPIVLACLLGLLVVLPLPYAAFRLLRFMREGIVSHALQPA